MTDLRNPRWRASKGLPEWEAERRIVEAINVLDSMGSFRPVTSSIPAKPFTEHIAARFKKIKGESHGVRVPDYISFIGYVHGVLENAIHIPGVTKVDFLVEQDGNVTEILRAYHSNVKTSLSEFGRADLIALMGEFRPGGKDLIPPQPAGVFCWFLQRQQSGKLHGDWPNARRWNRLIRRLSLSDFGPIFITSKPKLTSTTAKESNCSEDEDSAGSQARQVELERSGA